MNVSYELGSQCTSSAANSDITFYLLLKIYKPFPIITSGRFAALKTAKACWMAFGSAIAIGGAKHGGITLERKKEPIFWINCISVIEFTTPKKLVSVTLTNLTLNSRFINISQLQTWRYLLLQAPYHQECQCNTHLDDHRYWSERPKKRTESVLTEDIILFYKCEVNLVTLSFTAENLTREIIKKLSIHDIKI